MPLTVLGLITMPSVFHHPYPTDCFHHVPNTMTQEKASYQDRKEQLPYWLENSNPFPVFPISCTPLIHQKSSSHYSSFKSKQRLKIPQKGGFIFKKPPSSSLYLFPVADSVSVSFQNSDSSLKIIGFYIKIFVSYLRPPKPSPPPRPLWSGIFEDSTFSSHPYTRVHEDYRGNFLLFWRSQFTEKKWWRNCRNCYFYTQGVPRSPETVSLFYLISNNRLKNPSNQAQVYYDRTFITSSTRDISNSKGKRRKHKRKGKKESK